MPNHQPYIPNNLASIAHALINQDNRCTSEPAYCVQIWRRDVGYDSAYADSYCWYDSANDETVYDDDPNFRRPVGDNWEQFGYVDRWETVMVAFTEAGCKSYMELDGHNVKSAAFRGQWRIYVQSFNRCVEMITIRNMLKQHLITQITNERDHFKARAERTCVGRFFGRQELKVHMQCGWVANSMDTYCAGCGGRIDISIAK